MSDDTYKDNEVCGGTGNHEGQQTDDCDECNPELLGMPEGNDVDV